MKMDKNEIFPQIKKESKTLCRKKKEIFLDPRWL